MNQEKPLRSPLVEGVRTAFLGAVVLLCAKIVVDGIVTGEAGFPSRWSVKVSVTEHPVWFAVSLGAWIAVTGFSIWFAVRCWQRFRRSLRQA